MITEKDFIEGIQKIAPEISPDPLCQAYYQPEATARPSCCFYNVWEKIDKDGGDICFGWTFSIRANPQYGGYIAATHHAVWHAPDKKLIDVTPFPEKLELHPYNWNNYVLFLIDRDAEPFNNEKVIAPLPTKHFAIGNNSELTVYVNKLDEKEQKACQEIYNGKFEQLQVKGFYQRGKFSRYR